MVALEADSAWNFCSVCRDCGVERIWEEVGGVEVLFFERCDELVFAFERGEEIFLFWSGWSSDEVINEVCTCEEIVERFSADACECCVGESIFEYSNCWCGHDGVANPAW